MTAMERPTLPPSGDYRRRFLMLASVAYLVLGISYLATPVTAGRQAGFAWLPDALSISTLGWVWVVVAVGVTVASLVWPTSRTVERWCFTALTIPPTLWAGIFCASWLLGAHPVGYASMISYGLMSGMTLLAASWPNPPKPGGEARD